MNSRSLTPDAQVIVLACTALASKGDRTLKPLSPGEWHDIARALRAAGLERPRALAGMSADDLRSTLKIDPKVADRLASLLARGGQLVVEFERLQSRGIWILTRADDEYPGAFKRLLGGQAPPVLFGAGATAHLGRPSVAIIGSRDVDDEGIRFARSLASRCAEQNFAVVSGAARGVDAAAMAGALERGGEVVGITVDPLEKLVARREFRAAIADEFLTLATPYHPSARWHQGNAMGRNRLIYTLSQAAVVVASTAAKGGTWAGATENLKAQWVPVWVRSDGTSGNRALLGSGAMPLDPDPDADVEITDLLVRADATLLASPDVIAKRSDTKGGEIKAGRESAPQPVSSSRTQVSGTANASPVPEVRGAPGGSEDETSRRDAFQVVWPLLMGLLDLPMTEREVADALDVRLGQARDWLARAVSDDFAEVVSKPKRYRLKAAGADQLTITDPKH